MDSEANQLFSPSSESSDVAPRPFFCSLRFGIAAIIIVSALLSVPIAFVIGAVIGNRQVYRNFSDQQQTRIESFLLGHPESFGDLTIEHAPDGWAYPIGTVPDQSDYDILADTLQEMFGDELSERMMRSVAIEAHP